MTEGNVFINCPFDEQYRALLRPLLFTLCYLNLTPRIASERFNSYENRMDKICELINVSDHSIHDISRCKSTQADEYFRMNMPFEFGIDYGYVRFNQLDRKMLVMEGERFDFQKTISDASGVDVKCHNNEPEDVIRCIRNWVIEADIVVSADSPTRIWYYFTDFTSSFYDQRLSEGFTNEDLNDMPTPEYIRAIQDWLGAFRSDANRPE